MKKAKSNNNSKWIIVVLILLAAIVAAVFLLKPTDADSMPATITVQQANERFTNGAYLLDVREQNEWDEGHIEGAVLIPLGELAARIDEVPSDQDVLVICRSGNRSGTARDILRDAGLNRTTSISGGINAWISAGLPVVTGP